MSIHHPDGARRFDPQDLRGGDSVFKGVDMLTDPERLEPGMIAFGKNTRMRNGKIEPRRGIQELEWAEMDDITNFWGSCVYASGSGYEWLLRCTDDAVIISRPEVSAAIPLPGGVTISAEVELIQANNKIIMFRGESLAPLVWTPTADPANPAENAFGAAPSPQGGREAISQSWTGLWTRNRLIVPHSRDEAGVSDVLDAFSYDPNNDLYLEKGAADSLVGQYPFFDDVIFFKDKSIHKAGPISGDLSDLVNRPLTSELGLSAQRAVAAIGRDLWFLSESGVMAFSQVLDNQLQGVAPPISQPMQPLIERITWASVSGAAAAVWGGRYYLAVPVDGAAYNNAVLVYDALPGTWQGFDTSSRHRISRWHKLRLGGRQRLVFTATDGKAYIYEEGREDRWDSEDQPIEMIAITRGYQCDYPDYKTFKRADADLATNRPAIQFSAVSNGFFDETNG